MPQKLRLFQLKSNHMNIDVTNRSGFSVDEAAISSLLSFAFNYLDLHPECELAVTFVDPKEMEELHIEWMDEPGSTDVLSFPMVYQTVLRL